MLRCGRYWPHISRLPAITAAVLLSCWAVPAHAEPDDKTVPQFFAKSYAGLAGLYLYGGASVWPKQTGLNFAFGLFHQHRFGLDVSASVHLVSRAPDPGPFVLSAITGRLVLLREGLSERWLPANPPRIGTIIGLRAGVGVLDNVGTTGQPVALLLGGSLEFLFGRTFLIGVRPSVGVRNAPTSNDSSKLRFQALPVVEISLGWISEAAYTD